MKKKIFILNLLMIGLASINVHVNAANSYATSSSDPTYNTLVSGYNNNKITKTSILTSGTVTLFGYSNCNGASCTYHYAGNVSTFEVALSKSVVCTGGEKYISYQSTGEGGKNDFMTDNKAAHNGNVYWSEDYYVTCKNSRGENTIELENAVDTNTDVKVEQEYNNTTTTDNPQTGVNTYFVVLGIISVISYGFMVFVKKFNLFKKI